jgi:hypothetical protein
MKATRIITALILTIILLGINAANASSRDNNKPQAKTSNLIRYEVNVILNSNTDLCNVYQVRVTDETGRLVAPPKTFTPGISKYVFTESAPAPGRLRIATLIINPDTDPYVCPNSLETRPDVKIGPFVSGQSYPFLLRPQTKPAIYIDR